jgi:hypothetical protein
LRRESREAQYVSVVTEVAAEARRPTMKIRSHHESHIVELDDGSKWKIFPGDLDLTLTWEPETTLSVIRVDDQISSYALEGAGERFTSLEPKKIGSRRKLGAEENWPPRDVKSILKRG